MTKCSYCYAELKDNEPICAYCNMYNKHQTIEPDNKVNKKTIEEIKKKSNTKSNFYAIISILVALIPYALWINAIIKTEPDSEWSPILTAYAVCAVYLLFIGIPGTIISLSAAKVAKINDKDNKLAKIGKWLCIGSYILFFGSMFLSLVLENIFE